MVPAVEPVGVKSLASEAEAMTEGTGPAVRVRGIYASALTALLNETDRARVVDPSSPIRARFDSDFEPGDPSVRIETTSDRLGVRMSGRPAATESVAEDLTGVGIDTFCIEEPAPRGAVLVGRIERTTRRRVIVDLGEFEGWVPAREFDTQPDQEAALWVQIAEPTPPWAEKRPGLTRRFHAPGGLASLRHGVDAAVAETPDGQAGHELARTTELLGTSVPERWGIVWRPAAIDAGMETLDRALSRVRELARSIEQTIATDPETEAVGSGIRPLSTRWVRFGREARFALDEYRRSVTETFVGHHRIKAAGESAATAVDFAEALSVERDAFPFDAVTETLGPAVGEDVRIVHAKPDGEQFSLGVGTVTDRSPTKARVTVERTISSSGTYDAIGTDREPGDVATTRFPEGQWWYPTVYRGEDERPKGTYVNIATPVEIFPEAIRYVDLYVDVIRRPDGSVEIVDEDELTAAREAGTLSVELHEKALDVASRVSAVLQE